MEFSCPRIAFLLTPNWSNSCWLFVCLTIDSRLSSPCKVMTERVRLFLHVKAAVSKRDLLKFRCHLLENIRTQDTRIANNNTSAAINPSMFHNLFTCPPYDTYAQHPDCCDATEISSSCGGTKVRPVLLFSKRRSIVTSVSSCGSPRDRNHGNRDAVRRRDART